MYGMLYVPSFTEKQESKSIWKFVDLNSDHGVEEIE